MKKTLLVLAVAAMFVFSFSSCGDTQTTAEILTNNTKGWVLSSATSSPAYVLSSGRAIENLLDGYFYDCEKDDIIIFQDGGIQVINPGANVDPEWGYQIQTLGTWSLSADNTVLNMQLPFFYGPSNMTYDQEQESCRIVSVSSKELVLEYAFNDNESPAKGEYTFTLTYVPAK
ncbi:MAG: hypothetical protein MJZ87_11455 [Bacteroidales bacterium]|nr:hypothetical protein [Bacteroidales bacterium]